MMVGAVQHEVKECACHAGSGQTNGSMCILKWHVGEMMVEMRPRPPAPLAVAVGPPEGHVPHAQDERAAGRDSCGAADVAP